VGDVFLYIDGESTYRINMGETLVFNINSRGIHNLYCKGYYDQDPRGYAQIFTTMEPDFISSLYEFTYQNDYHYLTLEFYIVNGKVETEWTERVVPRAPPPIARSTIIGIETASIETARKIIVDLPANTTIAVINISSTNPDISTYVIDELEYQLVDSNKFKIVDRKELDTIRAEQNFHLSGDVSDESAVSIGKLLGANIVITGALSGTGNTQRLTVRALDVKTAQILSMTREPIYE
jgi:hypothetical protein